jgi:vacuolar-type H+-ATPase subunit F/Vma7
LLGAAESVIGFLLLGWSTAFLVSVSARVRTFEAHIEQLEDKD